MPDAGDRPPTSAEGAVVSGEPPDATAPSAPTPEYVTKQELAQLAETVTGRIEGLIAGLQAARPAPAASAPTAPPPINLAEIDAMVREGREGTAEKVAALVDRAVDEKLNAFRAAEIGPLRQYGLGAIEQLSRDSALGNDPIAKRYEKEITASVASLPEHLRADPRAWLNARNLVRGAHLDELLAEEREKTLRQAAERPPESGRHASTPQLVDDQGQKLPSLDELAGADGMAALREKGMQNGDEFARRMGYDSWKDYMAKARKAESGEVDY